MSKHDLRKDIGILEQEAVSDDLLEAMLGTLTPREARVMRLYYFDGLSERRIGQDVPNTLTGDCITGERVNQIRTKALRKLRHPSRLGDYIVTPKLESLAIH